VYLTYRVLVNSIFKLSCFIYGILVKVDLNYRVLVMASKLNCV